MSFEYAQELQAIRDALEKQDVEVDFGPASEADMDYLRSMGYPESVCQFYEEAEPERWIEINEARLDPISEMRIENEQAVPGYIIVPLGYRVIGTTITGDAYCIDINAVGPDGQPAVFLATHDEIYEDSTEEEIRAGIIQISSSFREFLGAFAEGKLTVDFYDLKEDRDA